MSVENLAVLRRIPVIVAIRVVDEVGGNMIPRRRRRSRVSDAYARALSSITKSQCNSAAVSERARGARRWRRRPHDQA